MVVELIRRPRTSGKMIPCKCAGCGEIILKEINMQPKPCAKCGSTKFKAIEREVIIK
jgi:hypothetical protein